MPKELILHIGHAKTGTTTLQETLKKSGKALQDSGAIYPPPVRFNNHKVIGLNFFESSFDNKRFIPMSGGSREAAANQGKLAWESFIKSARSSKAEKVVMSAESFFRFGRQPESDDFVGALRQHFEKITVVAYLREPSQLHLSLMQQHLKHRPSHSFRVGPRDFFRIHLEPLMARSDLTLHVHSFSRGALIGGDIVEDFVTRYLPEVDLQQLRRPSNDLNVTVSSEAMSILQSLWQGELTVAGFPKMGKQLNNIVQRVDAAVPGNARPKYQAGVAAFVYDRCTDLDWLSQTFGISFQRPAGSTSPGMDDDDLSDVTSVCAIDEDRIKVLWREVQRAARRDRSLIGHYDEFLRNLRRWNERLRS